MRLKKIETPEDDDIQNNILILGANLEDAIYEYFQSVSSPEINLADRLENALSNQEVEDLFLELSQRLN